MATYIWKKYNIWVTQTQSAPWTSNNSTTVLRQISGLSANIYCASSFEFDSNAGAWGKVYKLPNSGVVLNTSSGLSTAYPYTMLASSYANGVNGGYLYEFLRYADGSYSGYIEFRQYQAIGKVIETYSAGTYIEDVAATDLNAYPANGQQNGYWYIYSGEKSGGISGQVIISGVMCELTGEGYVNVNGVLRPISDSGVNIGGIIKSAKG